MAVKLQGKERIRDNEGFCHEGVQHVGIKLEQICLINSAEYQNLCYLILIHVMQVVGNRLSVHQEYLKYRL